MAETIFLMIISCILGILLAIWYIGKIVIVPLCAILFGSVSGRAAEDFCNQCCVSERGEKIAQLFYIFYKAGHNCTTDERLSSYFDKSLDSKRQVKKILKLISEELAADIDN